MRSRRRKPMPSRRSPAIPSRRITNRAALRDCSTNITPGANTPSITSFDEAVQDKRAVGSVLGSRSGAHLRRGFIWGGMMPPVFIRACAMTCTSLAVLVGAGISQAVAQRPTDQEIREWIPRSVADMKVAIKRCDYEGWKGAKRIYDEVVENAGRLKIAPPEAPTFPIPCNPVTTDIRTQQETARLQPRLGKPLAGNRSLVPEEADRYLGPPTSFLGPTVSASRLLV